MKDSAIGAYGAIGLILLFAIKFFALKMLLNEFINHPYIQDDIVFVTFLFLIATHSISRLTAISIIFTTDYVREDELSKANLSRNKILGKKLLVLLFLGYYL